MHSSCDDPLIDLTPDAGRLLGSLDHLNPATFVVIANRKVEFSVTLRVSLGCVPMCPQEKA